MNAPVPDWIIEHSVLLIIATLTLSVVALALWCFVLVRLPADQFTRVRRVNLNATRAANGHIAWVVLRNSAGVILFCAGVVLSLPLVPGPGLLMILVGLSLTSFPGKRRIELLVLRQRFVLRPVNSLRARFGVGPLLLPGSAPHRSATNMANIVSQTPSRKCQ